MGILLSAAHVAQVGHPAIKWGVAKLAADSA